MRDRDASCDSQLPLIACAHSGMSKCDSIHKQKKELIYVLWLQRLTTRDIGPRLPPLFLSIRLDRLGYQSCETLLQCSQAGVLTKLDIEGGTRSRSSPGIAKVSTVLESRHREVAQLHVQKFGPST